MEKSFFSLLRKTHFGGNTNKKEREKMKERERRRENGRKWERKREREKKASEVNTNRIHFS